ncbi:MAG: hypothetical protein B6D72_15660 [gamma proteobacterium symbiont of Ctena orbiculata]|nr:2Fe-2S iron-sulfur cluster binding domain-containing protein [Candidatus Thiodiazotropha taylori]PUB87149.1 MAG: hypothetical protein DBP00_09075 [gamma proteobacterium symbiont of Ctena orbiculata]MBT2995641.1 2Fe-2S iron-sulfur cluster binding domain-containing protein [Candidatus Thiodiazotropha taylori]MBT2999405.1 2Fe-2S iron-sulfur cluster binding domain-containing protein [Candidatus Thiodiazotropha taylori]MBV2106498.1 2Fe-2S iron-sulfur cluster binding domain-containing protein [Can
MSDDLIIIAAIMVLAIVSVGIRLLARRKKTILVTGDGNTASPPGLLHDMSVDGLDITVTFSESAKQYRWLETNDSLLEFAESRGIEVESLCRAGECGSCRTKLIEGEVEYHQEPAINPGRGYCLLCIAKPRSDIVLAK